MTRSWSACALIVAAVTAWSTGEGQRSLDAAQVALDAGDYARAVEQAGQAAAAFHSGRDATGEKTAQNIAGSAHLYRGEYDAALESYQAALAIDRRQGDASGEITRLTNIGSVYFYRGRYSDALARYEEAMARVRRTGLGGQLVYSNLATLYQQLGDDRKAMDYYRQALALGASAELLSKAGTLYRRLGDTAQALESYRAARALYVSAHRAAGEVRVLEETGIAQAMELHDLQAAAATFGEAVTLAPPGDLALAHLYRGEALYRLHRPEAAEDFRAAGDNWLALYRLGELDKALALRDTPLPPEFFPGKQELYDAAIQRMVRAGTPDPQQLFALLERLHGDPDDPASLAAIQARLAPGSLLVETRNVAGATLWITKDRAAVGGEIPYTDASQLLLVPDEAEWPDEHGHLASTIPYASLLVRDEAWRTPLMPWRQQRLTVAAKRELYGSDAPILIFGSAAVVDGAEPNRSHVVLSPSESLYRAEIRALPLTGTDLVVLPFVDTARVLSTAFLEAGARSVLTMRAPATAGGSRDGFLRRFFQELSGGKSKSAALHQAALAFPAPGEAFVLAGDGQQPARPVLSWWWIAAPGILAAGTIVLLLRR